MITWLRIFMWSLLPLIILLSTPTSLNIKSIDAYGLNTVTGEIYLLVIIYLLVYFGYGLWQLRIKYNDPKTTNAQKTQLRYIFAGVITAFIPAFTINAVLPFVTGDSLVILYGPNAIIFLALFMTIAIVKHQLLDIRLIVARFLAYVLLLSSLIAVYAALIFLLTERITYGSNLAFIKNAVPFIAAILIALSFSPLKHFFDRITNKLFYQDAYEPQNLLNELNSALVTSIDVNSIIKNTTLLINHYLRPQYATFYIFAKDKSQGKMFSTNGSSINAHEDEIRSIQKQLKLKVINMATDSEILQDIKDLANKYNIGHITSLDSSDNLNSAVGAIVLGQKKSGSLYGKQDDKVMEIIADELVIALQNALRFEEIQQFNVTLQKKVDDATKELQQANEKLIALDQTKDDFISMASHQLRTPLTSIKGYVSMVIEGDVGKITKQQHKLLDQAFLSSQRMVYLIADLLNVSRLKTGKFIIETKPTNLADLVEGELSQLTETIKAKKLNLTYNKPKDFPLLMLDDTKTRQVVMNFADNAIYYTPEGGKIDIIVEDKGDTVEFRVEDNGIGVPKSEQHNLFGKFYRAGNARKARPDGTGLGLFMAKKVIIAQGGALIFKSVENKGSTFGFSFSKNKLKPPSHLTVDKKPKS